MLFGLPQPVPDARVEVEIQARQDHTPHRRLGHGSQHIRRRRCGAGGTGGDDRLGRRPFGPGVGQPPQQGRPPPRRIDEPELGQASRPGIGRQPQEVDRLQPVFGHVSVDQALQPGQILDLFQLAGIEKPPQRLGQVQRPHRTELGPVTGHQPRQLETAGQGRDGRRQVQTQLSGRERRLVLLQIAQRPNLR